MGVGIPSSNPDNIAQQITWAVLLPPIVALLLTEPGWVLGSGITILAIVIARAGGRGVYTSPIELTLYSVLIGGMVLSRLATDAAQHIAAANARAEAALRVSEHREGELTHSNAELQRLIDEIRTREAEQARPAARCHPRAEHAGAAAPARYAGDAADWRARQHPPA